LSAWDHSDLPTRFATLVIVVDLPKELAIDEFEAAEVVLSTGIIVPRELVKAATS